MSKQRFQAYISVLHGIQNLALLYAVIIGILWYVKGRMWFKHTILPVHERIFYGLLALTVLVLVPLLVLKASRPYSRYLFYQLPYFFGAIAWFFAADYCLNSLGKFWFIFGSCVVGFGVFPIALVGTIIKGHWSFFGFICLQLAVTFGCRYLALASVPSSGEENGG